MTMSFFNFTAITGYIGQVDHFEKKNVNGSKIL